MEAPTHPLQRLIDRGPNPHQTWSDWLERTRQRLLGQRSQRDRRRRRPPGRAGPDRWDLVSIVQLPGDRIAYDVANERTGGTRRLLPERDPPPERSIRRQHGRRHRLPRAAGVVGNAQALNHFAGAMWRNGVNPSGAVRSKASWDPKLSASYRQWRQLYAGLPMLPDARFSGSRREMAADRRVAGKCRAVDERSFSCEEIATVRYAADHGRHLGQRELHQ